MQGDFLFGESYPPNIKLGVVPVKKIMFNDIRVWPRGIVLTKIIADTIYLSDQRSDDYTKNIVKILSDSVTFSEAVASKNINKSLNDSFTLNDAFLKAVDKQKALNDTISLSEFINTGSIKVLTKSLSDTVFLSDSSSKLSTLNRSLSDIIILSEVVSRGSMINRSISDSVVLSDVRNSGGTLYKTLSDGISLTDMKYKDFGYLYNWYAANNVANIAPVNWRIPSISDYTVLVNYLGGELVSGGKLKITGTTYWNTPNTGATNSSGFTSLAGGGRAASDPESLQWNGMYSFGFFWTSDSYSSSNAYYIQLSYNSNSINVNTPDKHEGYSVRLVRESTTLTNGQSGSVIIDGQTYRTICIGTQEWLAENLKTRIYRNGTSIPEITVFNDWKNPTSVTGKRCIYPQ